jgi:hypothetical protein
MKRTCHVPQKQYIGQISVVNKIKFTNRPTHCQCPAMKFVVEWPRHGEGELAAREFDQNAE